MTNDMYTHEVPLTSLMEAPRTKREYKGPSTPAGELALHTRGYEATLRLIEKTKKPGTRSFTIPEALQHEIDQNITAKLKHYYWTHARDKAIESSYPSYEPMQKAELAKTMDGIASETLHHYIESLYVRSMLIIPTSTQGKLKDEQEKLWNEYHDERRLKKQNNEQDTPDFYRLGIFKRSITHLLTNHVTNISDAKLCALGLNEESTHSLQGNLIKTTIDIYEDIDYRHAKIEPRLGSLSKRSVTDLRPREEVIKDRHEQLKNYRFELKKDLTDSYQKFLEEQKKTAAETSNDTSLS